MHMGLHIAGTPLDLPIMYKKKNNKHKVVAKSIYLFFAKRRENVVNN